LNPDLFGDDLIERDRIAKRTAAGMRRGGQEANIRRMAAVNIRMRDAAEHCEVVPVRLQQFQIWRGDVFAPGAFGEEVIREQSQVIANRQHAARLRSRFGLRQHRLHHIQKRERQRGPGSFE
jgi:hypothetical protein